MARTQQRPRLLSLVFFALGAWMLGSTLFVAPPTSRAPGGLRGSRAAMHAAAKEEEIDLYSNKPPKDWNGIANTKQNPSSDKMRAVTGVFEYSTGARNEISLVTPELTTKDVQSYLSLNIMFLGGFMFLHIGGMVESQRFFPDALMW